MLRRSRFEPIPRLPMPSPVVQVCHPDWRGVRASAEAFGEPLVLSSDLSKSAAQLVEVMRAAATHRLVIQAWPHGAAELARRARGAGIRVAVVNHASMAQHGTDTGEAEAVSEVFGLVHEGVVDRFGFVKAGLAETFQAIGFSAEHLPNRLPAIPAVRARNLGSGDHVGVFLHPYWRKNVATQVAAGLLLAGTVHVMIRPNVPYFPPERVVEHGELPRDDFLALLAGVGLNLNVTLSECHPMTPMESYLLGVPCLVSRTSDLFADDPGLRDLAAVVELDNPTSIATQGRELLAVRDEVVPRAVASLRRADAVAAAAWQQFVT